MKLVNITPEPNQQAQHLIKELIDLNKQDHIQSIAYVIVFKNGDMYNVATESEQLALLGGLEHLKHRLCESINNG